MKKKNEENLPEQGCGTKMPAENEATNEVVKNETVSKETAEEQQDDDEARLSLIEAWAPFLQKFIKVMIAIEDLVEAKREMEHDPYFSHVMKKFIAFKEKYEAEHPELFEETDDEEDGKDELFDVVKMMRDKLEAHGISLKVRKVTDPEEVKKFESFMGGSSKKSRTTPVAEA
jgi:hypothetical protein